MSQQAMGEEANLASSLAIPLLTNDQVHRLLSLIELTKPGFEKLSGNSSWIIILRHHDI